MTMSFKDTQKPQLYSHQRVPTSSPQCPYAWPWLPLGKLAASTVPWPEETLDKYLLSWINSIIYLPLLSNVIFPRAPLLEGTASSSGILRFNGQCCLVFLYSHSYLIWMPFHIEILFFLVCSSLSFHYIQLFSVSLQALVNLLPWIVSSQAWNYKFRDGYVFQFSKQKQGTRISLRLAKAH